MTSEIQMPPSQQPPIPEQQCHFCGKPKSQVVLLIKGSARAADGEKVSICDQCVVNANDLVREETYRRKYNVENQSNPTIAILNSENAKLKAQLAATQGHIEAMMLLMHGPE